MRKEIIINSTNEEVRIAITEDGKLVELYVETSDRERYVGNIYFGKVGKVLPGIQAAFINVGHKQDAFLHFSDIGTTYQDFSYLEGDVDLDNGEDNSDDNEKKEPSQENEKTSFQQREIQVQKITEQLKTDGKIVVQVTKEPTGNKGVRVTSEISLPGRYLVFLPFGNRSIGVSKKVMDFKEKNRLRRTLRNFVPRESQYGVIIRTNAVYQSDELLKKDLDSLIEEWKEVEVLLKNSEPPKLIYKEGNALSTVLRDLFSSNVENVVVDSKIIYRDVVKYLTVYQPAVVDKVQYYKGKDPIFDVFGVEKEVEKAIQKKVMIPSGGSIVIEQTEAMTVVDVNTGKFARKQEQELNSLQTNMEAAREVARQLRLRDIGGIVVIDFIDLTDEKNQKRIFEELKKEMRKDKAKSTILPMSEFGIVQLTRQRIRQSVIHSFSEPCPNCKGVGIVISKSTTVNNIERWLRRFKSENHGIKRLTLVVNPHLIEFLHQGFPSKIFQLKLKFHTMIKMESSESVSQNEFKFLLKKNKEDITQQFLNVN